MRRAKDLDVFLALLRAGLWEDNNDNINDNHNLFEGVEWGQVYRLAQEQSVIGLVAAGLEYITDMEVPQSLALTMAGEVLQLEQRNRAMNAFIASLIVKMRASDSYPLLVKGQGIAQCYLRPLWRTSGDVDLIISNDDYEKAKSLLIKEASFVGVEESYKSHLQMVIDGWDVELHGTMRSELWKTIDRELDSVLDRVFSIGCTRCWMNGKAHVFIPREDDDVIFVFAHILQHFFYGGIGLRQLCDLNRLLWVYNDSINTELLKTRIYKMGVMTEWKSFAALSVNYLGFPAEKMPFYSSKIKWKNKADRVLDLIIETGNFGHNKDRSYLRGDKIFTRKIKTFYNQTMDNLRQMLIFPLDAAKVWIFMVTYRMLLLFKNVKRK